ncbi:MAG TPA: carboxymuconolactone decarboxylase family protein [Rhodocyclaceae bacterium]|nr:carboxymuconolactone decarboxylase family protein [Rhodocyclaceae bacterium]
MENLTPREKELVALGAALASNCVPCIEYHIPAARKAGLTDAQIRAAIELADKVRQVPAKKVIDAANLLLGGDATNGGGGQQEDSACAAIADSAGKNCC